ncbi:MAG: glycosyltransferase family 39 protein [Firmicutes bacterium]|nr:glycosyltransferase family 39 protein [Bacillota bacterium]
MKITQKIHIALLSLLSAFIIAFNFLWIFWDRKLPILNNLVYLMMCQEYHASLLDGDLFSFLINRGNFYPPLPFQITALVYTAAGKGYVQAVMSQSVFWVVMIFSVYLLASRLWNENIGFFSAFLAGVIPQTIYYSRQVGVDTPMAAMVPLTIYCLYKSEKFINTKWSILFALSFTIGMLLKWSFLPFVILPVGIIAVQALYEAFRNQETRKGALLFPLVSAVVLGLFFGILRYIYSKTELMHNAGVVETCWYVSVGVIVLLFVLIYFRFGIKLKSEAVRNLSLCLTIFFGLTAHFVIMHVIPMREIYRIWFWDVQYNLLLPLRTPYYFFVDFLIYRNFGVPFFILLIAAIVFYYLGSGRKAEASVLPVSMLFGIGFLYFQPIYDSRYFMPINGIAAMFIALLIMRIPWKALKIPLMVLVVLYGLYNICGWSFAPGFFGFTKISMGTQTPPPNRTVNNMKEGVSELLNIYRREKPDRGTLIVAKDDSEGPEITPLLILYYFNELKTADELAAMFYLGADPIFPERKEPWGFLLTELKDDKDDNDQNETDDMFYLKDIDKDAQGKEKNDNPALSLQDRLEGVKMKNVDAGDVVLCRFRTPEKNEAFPAELLSQIHDGRDGFGRKPVKSIKILENVIMDIYMRTPETGRGKDNTDLP